MIYAVLTDVNGYIGTHLELRPRYWRITRHRLDRAELDREVGWLTIPEPPLPTMLSTDDVVSPPSAAA